MAQFIKPLHIMLTIFFFLTGVLSQNSNVFDFLFQEHFSDELTVEKIPKFPNVVLQETTVSGFSSGSFFASQFGTAHSSYVKGVGLVAGGPYACVKKHPLIVNCLGIVPLLTINMDSIIDEAKQQSTDGNIDAIADVKNQRVFIYSGLQDTTITTNVVKKTNEFYQDLGDSSKVKLVTRKGEHMFPTDFDAEGHGNCAFGFYPFVANCGYDGAGNLLQHVLGTTLSPRNDGEPSATLLKFNQTEIHPNPASIGLGEHGFLYIPQDCRNPETHCKLHVVFHGCQQPVTYPLHWNMHFIRNSGYIRVADTNKIILAFPQTVSRLIKPSFPYVHPGSLLACWDMFGMYGNDYATKNGKQIRAIQQLIEKIVS